MDKILQPSHDRNIQGQVYNFRKTYPLILITAFFILGIIAASYNWLTDKLSFPFLIVSLLVLTFGIIRKWRYNFALAYIAFFLTGVILSSQQVSPYFPQNHIKMLVEHYNNEKKDELGISIEGVLANAPERFSDKTRLYIDAKKIFTTPPAPPLTKGGQGGGYSSYRKNYRYSRKPFCKGQIRRQDKVYLKTAYTAKLWQSRGV